MKYTSGFAKWVNTGDSIASGPLGMRPALVFRAEVDKIEFPIKAEGRKSNSMQPIFVMTNDRSRGGFEAAPWSVAYYFFGL